MAEPLPFITQPESVIAGFLETESDQDTVAIVSLRIIVSPGADESATALTSESCCWAKVIPLHNKPNTNDTRNLLKEKDYAAKILNGPANSSG